MCHKIREHECHLWRFRGHNLQLTLPHSPSLTSLSTATATATAAFAATAAGCVAVGCCCFLDPDTQRASECRKGRLGRGAYRAQVAVQQGANRLQSRAPPSKPPGGWSGAAGWKKWRFSEGNCKGERPDGRQQCHNQGHWHGMLSMSASAIPKVTHGSE